MSAPPTTAGADTLDRLLAAVRRRAEGGDALWQATERTEIAFESGRLKSAAVSEGTGINLRVLAQGRAGVAGTTAVTELDGLLDRALTSAALGDAVPLAFPGPAAVPAVPTFDAAAAAAPLDALIALGRDLAERLARPDCQVNVSVERVSGEAVFANTAGAAGVYRSTIVGVAAELRRIAGDDVLILYDHVTAAGLPDAAELQTLHTGLLTKLELGITVVEPPEGALPVVFTTEGLSAILLPLEQACSGKAVLQGVSPLAGKVGERLFDASFALTDDPLAPGRSGSRPFDDEGVPSAPRPLVADGVVRGFIYDLETAARAGVASTGHGHRGTFGKPHVDYTNLVVGAGPGATAGGRSSAGSIGGGLLAGIKDGLVVDDLIGVGQGNVMSGAFSHPVALAYRVRDGAIVGRVKDAAVAGNVYELLRRIGGMGDDGRWRGSRWAPSLLLDGVSVARR